MESRLGTVRGHEAVIASLTDAHACIGGGQRAGPGGFLEEGRWAGFGPRGPGAWGKGAGSDRFGPAGRPPALSQRARAQGLEGKGGGLPPAAPPARPAGRGTHLACPRRPSPSPRRSHPCPSALPLSPRETRRAGHGPTPGPPGTDIGVPGAALPDHRQVPELGDGEGRGQRGGKGTVGRTDEAVRRPEKALASHPQPALPTGTTRGRPRSTLTPGPWPAPGGARPKPSGPTGAITVGL